MFNFFGKKKLIKELDYELLMLITNALPQEYSYLVHQVSKDFILDKKVNPLGDKGTYTLTLNAKLESKYSNKLLPRLFIIKDIGIWNNLEKSYKQMELHILEGMLAGFKIDSDYKDLDFQRIDTSKIKEKHF